MTPSHSFTRCCQSPARMISNHLYTLICRRGSSRQQHRSRLQRRRQLLRLGQLLRQRRPMLEQLMLTSLLGRLGALPRLR